MTTTRTYHGRCHCGDVRFTITCDEITTGCRCNCSICRRKSTIMSSRYFLPEELVLERRESLTRYQFGDHLVNHYFCGRCGISTFHDATEKPGHYRVNLGCVDEVEPLELELTMIDGRSW